MLKLHEMDILFVGPYQFGTFWVVSSIAVISLSRDLACEISRIMDRDAYESFICTKYKRG